MMILANVAWTHFYNGDLANLNAGNFAYDPANPGDWGELYNFYPTANGCRGYVPFNVGGHFDVDLNLANLQPGFEGDSLPGCTVIWTAQHPEGLGRVIVGWYRNATIYRTIQQDVAPNGEERSYRFSASKNDCFLISPRHRNFSIMTAQQAHAQNIRGAFPGQAAIFYAPQNPQLMADINDYISGFLRTATLAGRQAQLEEAVQQSLTDTPQARAERLAAAPTQARRVEVLTYAYVRNPDVIASVLFRAKGLCEGCNHPAPFLRRAGGMPYLEVHHRIPLAYGGLDTVANAVALCPNCHRREHFGENPVWPYE